MRSLKNSRILVIGDLMLDRYVLGQAERISAEAPVPIVLVREREVRLGAAANVALNLASLGVRVTLVGCVGDDAAGRLLSKMLEDAGITARLHVDQQWPTTEKWRVLAQGQQLIRLDMEEELPAQAGRLACRLAAEKVRQGAYQAVLISDYDKGVLGDASELLDAGKEAAVPIFVDPKYKNAPSYAGVHLLKPNLKEFEALAGSSQEETEFEKRGAELLVRMKLKNLLVTRGEKGMTLFRPDIDPVHFPARSTPVYDVTGAGDTVFAVLAAVMTSGMDIAVACKLANAAGAWAIRQVGNASLSIADLRRILSPSTDSSSSLLGLGEAETEVREAQKRGETVVFTNGCFDILHQGHTHLLQSAKALGDRLLVALNDDASVSFNKGPDRPVNPLSARAAVLAALDCVDWLISFSEPSPEKLLQALRPNILVKGSDYQVSEIIGADLVKSYGGAVRTVELIPGTSSTALLERLLGKKPAAKSDRGESQQDPRKK